MLKYILLKVYCSLTQGCNHVLNIGGDLFIYIELKCWSQSLHTPCICMFVYSPQEEIIVEFIKMAPFKIYICLILNTVLLAEWSTAVFISLVIVVHEVLVWQLNCLLFFRKILQLTLILWISSIVVYLNPFQQWLYDIEIHLFTPRTEGLIRSYYRRFKHSPMLQKEKPCIKSRGWTLWTERCIFFLFCQNVIFFSFSTALQKLQKIDIVHVFQKTL